MDVTLVRCYKGGKRFRPLGMAFNNLAMRAKLKAALSLTIRTKTQGATD